MTPSEPVEPAFAPPSSPGRSSALAVVAALGVWAVSTFGHGTGLELAYRFFAWAQRPGTMHPDGGRAGLQRAEWLLGGLALLVALAALAQLARKVRAVRPSRAALLEAAVPWLLWAALVYLLRLVFIVYATEFAHFVQYALVAFLLCAALGGGRPQLAFLITCGLGFTDELYQHYILHDLLMGDRTHWMDWSDPVLDALGAAGGVLPFTTLLRLRAAARGEAPPDTWHLARRAVLGASVALLPLLLLDDVQVSRYLGHYRAHPFWGEFANDKPTHWPSPRRGIPLCIGGLLVTATLVEPRRRGLSVEGALGLALLAAVAIDPPSRREGRAVHEDVPRAPARRVATPPVIDGVLDDAAWQGAAVLGPFVRAIDAAAVRAEWTPGAATPQEVPLRRTTARLAWDDQALYVAFEVEDPDPWSLERADDHPDLAGASEGVAVVLDDGGDEVTYVAFGVTPTGRRWDRFCLIPEAPVDYEPWQPFLPIPRWDARDLELAVRVDGEARTVEQPLAAAEVRRAGPGGYVVEAAFPWENLRTDTTPSDQTYATLPPAPGSRWRVNLLRFERARPGPEQLGDGSPLDAAAAEALVGCGPAEFARRLRDGLLAPGSDGRFARDAVVAAWADHRFELQAWSPTFAGTMHKPAWFGVLDLLE